MSLWRSKPDSCYSAQDVANFVSEHLRVQAGRFVIRCFGLTGKQHLVSLAETLKPRYHDKSPEMVVAAGKLTGSA